MFLKRTLWVALCGIWLLAVCPIQALADGAVPDAADAVTVTLSGGGVLADGQAVPEDDPSAAVYTAHDIVYYEAGRDFTYGECTAADEHTAEEAAEHTVVHIAQPGVYVLQGVLEKGQIAVDLGQDAKEDPDAVVTLVLDGMDVTCTVAPAVIIYNVYECDPEGASGIEPDLSGAGARVLIADGSENNVNGSYVARIYKSYTLNEDGTAVADSKKLHKYDGAFYSKMSMLVTGGPESTGVLNITAENEGLDTEMHLTVDGGNINIRSGNDGINVNEDDLSVVTVNGGALSIVVTGGTGEGDGIDSNGALVINSGTVVAQACSRSADSGLDASAGIYLNGGMVIAAGSMLDPVTPSDQCCAVFSCAQPQPAGTRYALTDAEGSELMAFTPENSYSILLMTSPALEEDTAYSLTADGTVLPVAAADPMGAMGGPAAPGGQGQAPEPPEGAAQGQPPELPEGAEQGQAPEPPEGAEQGQAPEPPEGAQGQPPEPPEGAAQGQPPEPPEGAAQGQPPELPEGAEQGQPPELLEGAEQGQQAPSGTSAEAGDSFTLSPGLNHFSL